MTLDLPESGVQGPGRENAEPTNHVSNKGEPTQESNEQKGEWETVRVTVRREDGKNEERRRISAEGHDSEFHAAVCS